MISHFKQIATNFHLLYLLWNMALLPSLRHSLFLTIISPLNSQSNLRLLTLTFNIHVCFNREVLLRWFLWSCLTYLAHWGSGLLDIMEQSDMIRSFETIWMVSIMNVRIRMWHIHLVMQSNGHGNKNVLQKLMPKIPLGSYWCDSHSLLHSFMAKTWMSFMSVFLLGCMNNADVQQIRFSLDSNKVKALQCSNQICSSCSSL